MLVHFFNPLLAILVILCAGFILTLGLSAARVTDIRRTALFSSTLALLVGLLSCLDFDRANIGFQFIHRFNVIPQYNMTFTLGADGLSLIFLLLTLFIFPPLFLAA